MRSAAHGCSSSRIRIVSVSDAGPARTGNTPSHLEVGALFYNISFASGSLDSLSAEISSLPPPPTRTASWHDPPGSSGRLVVSPLWLEFRPVTPPRHAAPHLRGSGHDTNSCRRESDRHAGRPSPRRTRSSWAGPTPGCRSGLCCLQHRFSGAPARFSAKIPTLAVR